MDTVPLLSCILVNFADIRDIKMSSETVIATWGPTQMGKSTFLSRFGGVSAATGTGNGRSVTASPELFETDILWPGESLSQRVSLIDMPGMNDTELRFTNQEVREMIRIFLGDMSIPKVDALLVMQSVADSSNQLRNSLKSIVKTFGEDAQSAIIVILTKIDVFPRRAPKMQAAIVKFCEENKLKYVEWTSHCSDSELSAQMTKFRTALQQTSPYSLSSNEAMKLAIESRAVQLRENDPDRFAIQKVAIPVTRAEVHQETTHAQSTEVVHKYRTAAEILEAAKERQRNGPKDHSVLIGRMETRQVATNRNFLGIRYTINRSEDVWVKETKMVERPLEVYISLVQEELVFRPKTEVRTDQWIETRAEIEEREILTEKYPLTHYISQAKKQLVREYLESLGTQAAETRK